MIDKLDYPLFAASLIFLSIFYFIRKKRRLLNFEKTSLILGIIALSVELVFLFYQTGIPIAVKTIIFIGSLFALVFVTSNSLRNLISNIFSNFSLGFISTRFTKSKITKKLGDPDNITEEGIQEYYTREKLQLEELFKEANQEIIFVGLSNEIVVRFNLQLLEKVIYRGVKITIASLNPNSIEVAKQEDKFGNMAKNFEDNITNLLGNLCDFVNTLNKDYLNKLIIKTFNTKINYSYIVIDPYSDNPIMKIEHHDVGDLNNRRSELAYRNDCNHFYQKHWETITSLKTDDYHCS